ncbi:(E2-independent) E3 ubiquitin-conjugating enzyme FATS isoform X1 [Clarias gariepinus]|uniref:(E2-independent) E3 ubiquitin-conjugating enzyme FATS isoform X1 n=1 Tax=Clarias gariepinus TaxID=13013 RepID=UPI00234C9B3C|nr:(E2-independent) E3 ubiquitin-conjugating enzyme FATS isoform X1 [Clarias gariepinus]
MPQSQAGEDGTSHVAWRRSSDESTWRRPRRAARPNSCIEGRLKDEWFQTLSDLQAFPIKPQLPPYSQKNYTLRSISPSLVASSQSSLESLYSEPESKERVQIKTGPSTERAKVCCLAPVRIGWLPLQRHMVIKERPNNAPQQDGNVCKVKLKPPITPVLSCTSVKENGGGQIAGFGVRRMSGAISLKADGKRQTTLAERDQDTALVRATNMQNKSRDGFLWQTPVHRRGSVSQVSHNTAPPVGCRMSPKPSRSISSITITSRKVTRSSSLPNTSIPGLERDMESSPISAQNNDITEPDFTNLLCSPGVNPDRKALVVKITQQREKANRFLQPGAKFGPVYSFLSSGTSGEDNFSRFYAKKSSDLVDSNLSSMKNYPSPTCLNVTGGDIRIPEMSKMTNIESHFKVSSYPSSQETQMPRELRKEDTITNEQKHKDTLCREEEDHRRKVANRHSCNGLKVTDLKPQFGKECMLSGSEMQIGSKTKLFKSTMSLQLTSSNEPRLRDPRPSRCPPPQRPSSCYGRLFSPVEPSADSVQDVADHSTISLLSHETNIDPACSAASSLNRCWNTEGGAGSHHKTETSPRTGSSASDKGQSKIESLLQRNQPLTLIKVPEISTHETHDAIVALNAAAIISSIKLQSEQKKKTQTNGNTIGKRDSPFLSKTAGARADKADMAAQNVTDSCPVETETAAHIKPRHAEFAPFETADDLLSQSHPLNNALVHQRSDLIRQTQAQKRQPLIKTHTAAALSPTSAQGQRETFGSGSN